MNTIIQLRKALLLVLCLFAIQLNASNFYWVGGSGNWTDYNQHWATQSGGPVFWNHVPTPTDTVIFDSLSFTGVGDTVYANNNVYCHTIKWLSGDSLPVFCESGTQPVLRIYGSMHLDTGVQWNYYGKIIFSAIGPGNTIQTNGNVLDLVYFAGDTTCSWQLSDTFNVRHVLFCSGNFYTNGQTIVSQIYEHWYSNLSRQYLDTSDVYCYRMRCRSTPLYLDADSATIIVTGDTLQAGNQHYYKIILRGQVGVSGNNTFDEVYMHTNSWFTGIDSIGSFIALRPGVMANIQGTLYISDTIAFNGGCSGMSALSGSGSIHFANAGVQLESVFVDGVNTSGFPTANNSVVLGATGWTTTNNPVPRTLYWVNGSGNWSDTLHWAISTGGIGNECSPTPIDNVSFDGNSFVSANEVSTADNHITLFNNMNCSGALNVPILNQDTGCAMGFGDLKLQAPVLWGISELFLRSSSPNTIIDVNNNSLLRVLVVGSGSFSQISPIHATSLIIFPGGYVSNGNSITTLSLWTGNLSGPVNYGGSTVNASRWSSNSAMGNFVAPDSLIVQWFHDMSTNSYPNIYAPSQLYLESNSTFSKVVVGGSALISGNSSFDTLQFIGSDVLIELMSGSTQTINDELFINSSCSAPATLRSHSTGSQAYLSKASGVINCDYLILEDVHAIGGATFNATNSFAMQNVIGWNITPPPSTPMYWIGGTGDWKNPAHWSYSSGGVSSGCIPNPLTDVYFDLNSFPSSSASVNMNVKNGYCNTMDWTTSTGSPFFSSPSVLNRMNCMGSVILEQGVNTYGANLFMRAQNTGNIIDSKNASVGNLIFNGIGGSWSLADTLACDTLNLQSGVVFTSGYNVSANEIMSLGSATRELHLDTSTIVSGGWRMNNDIQLILDASLCKIITTADTFQGGNHNYDDVTLDNQVVAIDSDTFRMLRISGSVTINGAQYVDSLFLDAGGDMIRLSNDTIHVDSAIVAISNSSSYIGIQAASPVDHAYISKPSDTVCLEYMILQGIDVSGGATFFGGQYSSDVDNNNGWLWQSCNPDMVNVWPGDANYDLVADNTDILSIGIAFAEAGGQRANASLNWVAQPNETWSRVFADSTDIVHADCDGDGIIGFADTNAVSLNYGQTHPPRLGPPPAAQSVGAELKLIVTQAAYQPGDTVELPIWLGTQNSPASNVYGLAFTVNWDHPFVEPGTLKFDYSNSWLLGNGNNVHLEKPFYSFQYCDLGMSRIDHNNASGTGELVTMRFVLTQNANGPLKFWFTDNQMIDHSEDTLPMVVTGGTINAAVGIDDYNQQEVSVYPNPTSGNLNVSSTLSGQGTITLYDVTGRVALKKTDDNVSSTSVNLEGLDAGYYFLVIETSEGSAQVRVQKL